ncbi:MAG TPA: hypothetical protein VG248_02210 [Caulobacteraceae bacterium]|jgi:hypothetical protein|nr:hypothetical protein [Caulobacteraceae bacterium]
MSKFLAVFTGGGGGAAPDADTIGRGMAAWSAWMTRHADKIVDTGGPLGKNRRVSKAGVQDASNTMAGYVIVEADDAEAAARMFESHPQFTIFPGDGVDVMPVLPIPGG